MRYILAAFIALAVISTVADAREFRERRMISAPLKADQFVSKNDGSTPVDKPVALDEQLIRSAIQSLFNNWGTGDIAHFLADKFPNRSQLLNAFDRHLPMDARLEVKSIRSIRILSQRNRENTLVSIVAADVETDVYYQDPTLGLQRLRGTGEYVFELVTRES